MAAHLEEPGDHRPGAYGALLAQPAFDHLEPSISPITNAELTEFIPAMIQGSATLESGSTPVHARGHRPTHALRRSTNLCTAGVSPRGCHRGTSGVVGLVDASVSAGR